MKEIWVKLVYPKIPDESNRFEISNCGRLKNVSTGHIYKPEILRTGYCSVRTTLGKRGNKSHILIHRAVAYAFLSNPNNLPEVNHKDGDKTNNHVDNLEWCTSHENQQHKYDAGLFDKAKISGENNHSAKLTVKDINYIRDNYVKGSKEYGAHALSKKFSVSHPTILSIINKKTWSCV